MLPPLLTLQRTASGRYLASSLRDSAHFNVIYSGEILAQMLMLPEIAGPRQMEVKTASVVFSAPARYGTPLHFEVQTVRSGRAWGSHRVSAWQGDTEVAAGLVLANVFEPDLIRHGPRAPHVPSPEELGDDPDPMMVFPDSVVRWVPLEAFSQSSDATPARAFWLRHPQAGLSAVARQAILAWAQPGRFIEVALRPHSQIATIDDAHRAISTGVIAHTARFHDTVDTSSWLLVVVDAVFAGRGRVHGCGRVFTRDGGLVASFEQDAMVRPANETLDGRRQL